VRRDQFAFLGRLTPFYVHRRWPERMGGLVKTLTWETAMWELAERAFF